MASEADLLAILNSQCQFALGVSQNSPVEGSSSTLDVEEDSEDEWQGISGNDSGNDEESDGGSDDVNPDGYVDDDEFTAGSSSYTSKHKAPSVMVFSDTPKSSASTSKAEMKTFMSSKISKLRETSAAGASKPGRSTEEEDEEKTNAANDALLHRLVHTQLLSGSLSEDLSLKPADRRKALQGRIQELAGSSKLGKGEKAVRKAERNKASKNVRMGLEDKMQERRKAQLEEAKNLGNYHPTLKRLYEDDSSTRPKKKRDRGLSMGVGRFTGGILKLSREDAAKAQSGGGGAGRGRGGRGGGGGGRRTGPGMRKGKR